MHWGFAHCHLVHPEERELGPASVSPCRRHLGVVNCSPQGLPPYPITTPGLLCTPEAPAPLHGIIAGPHKNPVSPWFHT